MKRPTRVLVPLAEGFEEIEFAAIVDVLRRGGLDVVTAAIRPGAVRGAHGVTVAADREWKDVDTESFDLLVLPGGQPGTNHLKADARVLDAVRRFESSGRRVAAICAAPTVLHAAGILAGRSATSYPGVRDALAGVALVADRAVVRDGRVTTSQGPGTAIAFALDLVAQAAGEERADEVARALLVERRPAG
jgi:4-methyl-5(b-hydroxyethyl)-thiazole monophosphate biosynthesis